MGDASTGGRRAGENPGMDDACGPIDEGRVEQRGIRTTIVRRVGWASAGGKQLEACERLIGNPISRTHTEFTGATQYFSE